MLDIKKYFTKQEFKNLHLETNSLQESCGKKNNFFQQINFSQNVKTVVGGSALNTFRFLANKTNKKLVYIGALGNDNNSRFIENELANDQNILYFFEKKMGLLLNAKYY